MSDNSFDATGTELFLSLDGTSVLKFDCPTGITGIGFTTGEIPLDCLDSIAETSRPGKKKIQTMTVPYIVMADSDAHEYLMNLINNPTQEIPYLIGYSDGTADPTITDGAFANLPSRSVIKGTGYVASNNVEINNGQVYRGSFTFMPQSQTFVPKA